MALTCAQLQKVVAKMDRVWADNQSKNDYAAEVGVLTALRENQTARMAEVENPDKDKTLRIWWLQNCGTAIVECATDADVCEFTGAEVEQKCQDYALDICFSTTFSIEDIQFRNNESNPEEALVINMMAALKSMDESLAQRAVAKLNSFAGINQYEGIADVDGVTTYIAPNFWGPDMYGYFGMVAKINKFSNPFLIHGSNLYQTKWQQDFNVANANQKDGLPKMNSMKSYWDLFNIDSVNATYKASYMIDKGAVAFASQARYPLNNPRVYQFGQRWSIESKALPGVKYDVYYKERCVADDKVWHDYKIVARAGIFNNPVGCNEDKTGVIKFVCGVNAGS